MEKYVNEDTIVKNEVYELLKDSIICPICDSFMIEPAICQECQYTFCKKCIKEFKDKGVNCPNRCSKSNFKDVIGKNNFISKFKFKCINGCGKEIFFNNIKNHYENCNPNNINKLKIKVLSKEQIKEFITKKDIDILHLKSN